MGKMFDQNSLHKKAFMVAKFKLKINAENAAS